MRPSFDATGATTRRARYSVEAARRGDVQLIVRAYYDAERDEHAELHVAEEGAPDAFPDLPPNELHVCLVRARGLLAMDSSGVFAKARSKRGFTCLSPHDDVPKHVDLASALQNRDGTAAGLQGEGL